MVRRALDPEIPVVQTVFLPLFQAAALGGERFLRDCSEHPDEVAAGLEILCRNTVKLIGALLDAGIDGIFLGRSMRGRVFLRRNGMRPSPGIPTVPVWLPRLLCL